ncbi:hypothetical protein ACFE04_026233 [Oxalis oulophora]
MGCVYSGRKCHGQALKKGLDWELEVENSLIHMYACFGDMVVASKVFEGMSKRDVVSWNTVIEGFVRVGEMGVAHQLFDIMSERNVVSWNVMISGCLRNGNPGLSLKLFRKMMNKKMICNGTTMSSVLAACGRSLRLKEGISVHGYLLKTVSKPSIVVETALIDMYSRCQKIEVARSLFNKIKSRNLMSWNAMILGHCIHGKPEDGLHLFEAMVNGKRSKSFRPDEVTFVGVLCACARAGKLNEGRNYFNRMIHEYHLKPNFGHYWCMANLYAGSGRVQEAEEILKSIPYDDENMSSESLRWANLLTSCRFQGDVTLGEKVAKSLLGMDSHSFSYHRLLMNIYAAAGRWEDYARVKNEVKEKKIGRMPTCNLIDLKEIVHDFECGKRGWK